MTDFHDSIITEAERLGATNVRIETAGFKRHPHITGMLNGKPFRYPLPGTVLDTRRRRLNYITNVRHFLLERGAKLPAKELEEVASAMLRRAARSAARRRPAPRVLAAVPTRPLTRLDRDPWAPLGALRASMEEATP